MKISPILFSTPMVQAIIAGRKTMTRRVVKPQPSHKATHFVINSESWPKKPWCARFKFQESPEAYEITDGYKCPYGGYNDVLWGREEHYRYGHWEKDNTMKRKTGRQAWKFVADDTEILYAENAPARFKNGRHHKDDQSIPHWYKRLGRFMPKSACRLFLRIKSVRVERLHEISEEDAIAEGIGRVGSNFFNNYLEHHSPLVSPIMSFTTLWQSINGADSRDANPWVWVITFERIEKPELFLTSNTNQNGRKKSTRKTQLVGVPTQTGR